MNLHEFAFFKKRVKVSHGQTNRQTKQLRELHFATKKSHAEMRRDAIANYD